MALRRTLDSSAAAFFLLLILVSIPLWILGNFVSTEQLPANLPISALMAFNPLIVAVILSFQEGGANRVKELLRQSVDFRSIRPLYWYAVVIVLMPFVLLVSYSVQTLLGGGTTTPELPLLALPILVVIFAISAFGEEVGWQGYAFERLQMRWGAFGSGIIIGCVWAVWHLIPYMQTRNTAWWILWQCIFSVVFRLLIVKTYVSTGRNIFAAIMLHTMYNVAVYMTPNFGSGYDPFLAAFITGLALLAIYALGAAPVAPRARRAARRRDDDRLDATSAYREN